MFNIDAARKAGWSDDAIFNYLAQSRGVSRESLRQSGITQPEALASLAEVDRAPKPPRRRKSPLVGIAKTFAPLGETIGAAIGASGAADTAEAISEQQRVSVDNLMKAYKQAAPSQKPRILKQLSELGGVDVVGSIPEAQKTTRQVIGEAGVTGLSALMGGLSGHGLGVKTAAGRIATDTALGGAFGLSRGLERNLKGGQLVMPTATSAIIGGAVSGLVEGASAAIQRGPERLFTSTKAMTRGQIAKNPGAPAEAIREGLVGNFDDMYRQAQAVGDDFESFIGKTLTKLDKQGKRVGIEEILEKLLAHKAKMAKGALYGPKLDQAYDDVIVGLLQRTDDQGYLTHAAVQELKRGLNQQLKGSFMRGLMGQGEAVQAERGAQSALRGVIGEHVDDIRGMEGTLQKRFGVDTFHDLNRRYGSNLALQDALEDKAAQLGTNNIFSINDAPTAILGAMAGNAVIPGAGGLAGGATGLAGLRKLLGTPTAKMYLAQALAHLRKTGSFERAAPLIQNLINQVGSTQSAQAPITR